VVVERERHVPEACESHRPTLDVLVEPRALVTDQHCWPRSDAVLVERQCSDHRSIVTVVSKVLDPHLAQGTEDVGLRVYFTDTGRNNLELLTPFDAPADAPTVSVIVQPQRHRRRERRVPSRATPPAWWPRVTSDQIFGCLEAPVLRLNQIRPPIF
jgi:hypothetical protein